MENANNLKEVDAQSSPLTEASHIPVSTRVGSQSKFFKVLRLRDLYFLCLGGSIGSAWLFGSLYGASDAGPAAVISWVIGGLIALVLAATWAEIGGILPSSGAVVSVPHYSHGLFTGFYFGWAYYLSSIITPPVEAVAIVTYASTYVPSLTSNGALTLSGYAVSISILVLTFALNSYGVKFFAKVNGVITLWKIAVPTFTIMVALFYFYPPNFTSFGGFFPNGVAPVFSVVGTAGIVYAYTGFRAAMDFSGEAKDPKRDVPRAMIYSVLSTMVIYTLLQTVFIGGIRWSESGLQAGDWGSLSTISAYASAPFYQLLSILGAASVATILLVDAVISPFGSMGVYTGSSARDLYALAEGGHLSKRMSEVHDESGVPRMALNVSLVIAVFLLLAFPNWSQLATIGTTATVFTQLAGATSLIVLRRNAGNLKRSFKVPAGQIVAPVAFVASSLVVYWTTWPYTGYSLVAFLLGLGIFMFFRFRGAYPQSDIGRGVWIVVFSICLTGLSYLGSYGIGVIPLPFDFVAVALLALVCYFWGIRSGYKTDQLTRILKQESVESFIDSSN